MNALVSPDSVPIASYRWYRVADDGTETLVADSENPYYVPSLNDLGYYLKVVGVGANEFSELTAQVVSSNIVKRTITSIKATGKAQYNSQIKVTVTPSAATAQYQWFSGSDNEGWTLIANATKSAYLPKAADVGRYVKVVVSGVGSYDGEISYVTPTRVVRALTSVTITATTKVGTNIRSFLTPNPETVTYQWYRGTDRNDVSEPIVGATKANYTPTYNDRGYYLKVVATGYGYYYGEVSATTKSVVPRKLVSISIADVTKVGTRIRSFMSPTGETITYQWYRGLDYSNITEAIDGATDWAYTPTTEDVGYYLKVVATGYDSLYGQVSTRTKRAITGSAKSSNDVLLNADDELTVSLASWNDD